MKRWIVTITKNSGIASGFLNHDLECNGGWSFSSYAARIFDDKDEAELLAQEAARYYSEDDIEHNILVRAVRIQGINEEEPA